MAPPTPIEPLLGLHKAPARIQPTDPLTFSAARDIMGQSLGESHQLSADGDLWVAAENGTDQERGRRGRHNHG
jgi:hypothetical protein